MGKKLSPKELREQKQLAQKQKYQQAEQTRKDAAALEQKQKEEAARRRDEEEARKKREKAVAEQKKAHPEMAAINKSKAKAAGLKSTFVLNDHELLMTSFGRGNEAVPEKRVQDGTIQNLAENLSIAPRGELGFTVKGRVVTDAVTDNPLYAAIADAPSDRGDLIGARRQLEQKYFGGTFSDNIHIQLIYNILDIDKILAVHVNNVVYELNNMLRSEEREFNDVVGCMSYGTSYEKFMAGSKASDFIRLMHTPQLAYFGTVLRNDVELKKLKGIKNPEKKAQEEQKLWKQPYYLLTALAMMRQATAHGNQMTAIFSGSKIPEMDKAVTSLYEARVRELNRDFLNKAQRNLVILFRAFNAQSQAEKKALVRDYYDFIVRKSYKNQGFSIKTLREQMILGHAPQIADKQYDTVRQKVNQAFDFILFEFYKQDSSRGLALVEQLRAVRTELAKQALYQQEAAAVWPLVEHQVLKEMLPQMNGEVIKAISADPDVTEDMIRDVEIGTDTSRFSKLMYLLTNFLDGKEINDLLTTLIHSFENIDSFLSVLKAEGLPCDFTDGYRLFANSKAVAQELRAINSFARMSKESPAAKRPLFMEAAQVLGYDASVATLEAYIDDMLDPKAGKVNYRTGKKDNSFRNFIANNVVESDRFKYLVRYSNPRHVRALANNSRVLSFVLQDIPDTQILRYYNACTLKNEKECTPRMRDDLCRLMTGISFRQFEGVHQGNGGLPAEMADKERQKAVIRLYLTVLYLLTKNLVYVNSRYFLAFHCVERDAMNLQPDKYRSANDFKDDFAAFARDMVAARVRPMNHAMKRLAAHAKDKGTPFSPREDRVTAYLKQNFDNADEWAYRSFRNSVEHLNAVRNAADYLGTDKDEDGIKEVTSYYALYHYLIQRDLKSKYDAFAAAGQAPSFSGKTPAYFDKVMENRTYCKDFVKALCVPFAYNLPRYKNLSIEALFDRNHPFVKGSPKDKAVAREVKLLPADGEEA